MPKVIVDLSMSLDGFVAGPNQTLDKPLGEGGKTSTSGLSLAAAGARATAWSGGEDNADSEVIEESVASTGAVVMGGACSAAARAHGRTTQCDGWWGDDPPFHASGVRPHPARRASR